MLSPEALTTAHDAQQAIAPCGHPGRPGASRSELLVATARRWCWRGRRWPCCPKNSEPRPVSAASTPPAMPLSAATTNGRRRCACRARRGRAGGRRYRCHISLDSGAAGARHPIIMLAERVADTFIAMDGNWPVGPGGGDRAQLRRPQLPCRPPFCAWRTRHLLHRREDLRQLLRTHTSPVQIRTLLARAAGLHHSTHRNLSHRRTLDANIIAHLLPSGEGLAVDRVRRWAHLRGTLDAFARAEFGPRLRGPGSGHTLPSPNRPPRSMCVVCQQDWRRRLGGVGRVRNGASERAAGHRH